MGQESRRHARVHVNAHADVIGREVVLHRPMADLSLGGCRFEGQAWEEIDTTVDMILSFPAVGANLPVSGVVVRAGEHDMGIRFTDLSEEQKWALRKHLRELHGPQKRAKASR